jgi:hypothetical protein
MIKRATRPRRRRGRVSRVEKDEAFKGFVAQIRHDTSLMLLVVLESCLWEQHREGTISSDVMRTTERLRMQHLIIVIIVMAAAAAAMLVIAVIVLDVYDSITSLGVKEDHFLFLPLKMYNHKLQSLLPL